MSKFSAIHLIIFLGLWNREMELALDVFSKPTLQKRGKKQGKVKNKSEKLKIFDMMPDISVFCCIFVVKNRIIKVRFSIKNRTGKNEEIPKKHRRIIEERPKNDQGKVGGSPRERGGNSRVSLVFLYYRNRLSLRGM